MSNENLWAGTEWDAPVAHPVRRLPEDPEAERAFLGTILAPGMGHMVLESTAYMDQSYFIVPQYRLIYRAAVELANTGTEITAVSLRNQLGDLANRAGGFTEIVSLISEATDYERPEVFGRIIKSKWQAREAMKALDRAKDAIEKFGEIGDSLEGLAPVLGALQGASTKIISHADLLDKAASGQAIMPADLASNKPVFGIPAIDLELNATPRRLGVIAAKTSAGKSSVSYQICVKTAVAGKRVLLVSLESDPQEVAAAIAANISGLSRSDIMRRGTVGFASNDLDLAKQNIAGYYAGSGATWESLESAIRAEHRRKAFDVVIVDYFTLLNPPEYKGRNMASLYGEISKAAKRMAQELDCSVILLSQFNRGIEDGAEPHLENLRETGQLEQDADWVLLMWAKPEDEADGSRIVHCKGAKNRGGRRGFKARMRFEPAQSRFFPLENETEIPAQAKTLLKKRKVDTGPLMPIID